jgi:cell wall-associated NlpC family hydrolase
MRRTTPNKPITVGVLLLCLLGLTLGCGVGGLAATSSPRWACPSPTPRPFGPDGPVKAQQPLPTAEPVGPQEYAPVYYEEWEQEYPDQGPPFPSPTPYALLGTSYTFGQRVEIAPLHLTVSARAGAPVERPGVPSGTQQLYLIQLTWVNPTGAAIPIDYAERVRLRAVTSPRGAVVTDANWGLSAEALQISQLPAPPDAIPPGESQVIVPILGPVGTPKTVDVVFAMRSAGSDPAETPTPNTDLQSTAPQFLTVQWSDTTLRVGPPCADAGALTSWGDAPGVAWGHPAAFGLAAPPGAARIVQLALAQVGKPYVWGAKGPERFDCSGLVSWLYAQIGLAIPLGTAGQWPHLAPVAPDQLQPGDLVFFDIAGGGRVDHVGMLIGDLNGDGRWDMVHAANPALGVRIDYGVLQSPYYTARIAGFRTVRIS